MPLPVGRANWTSEKMRISVDTNVLVRAILQDDVKQARAATKLLKEASLIALSLLCLCELVWILRQGAKLTKEEISAVIRSLLNAGNVAMDRPAVEAGLALLEAGGDFADGVMAYEGNWLGGETFVSFDKQAVKLIAQQGQKTRLLT
ncbi:MAG: type II toxin-antitoxin system VapC family toxin [Burkholderiales bacterium]|nr:type II toxin-antitoxin system VapC family toxin [Burkholderiales bacterium]